MLKVSDVRASDVHVLDVTVLDDRGLFDRNSLDQNCVLSVDRNFDNQLTEFLDAFQLIETFNNDFGQTPKFKAFDRII